MTEQYAPPTKPCMWDVIGVDESNPNELRFIRVGPCKTAYEAWRMSRLEGTFGDYFYKPIIEKKSQ